MQNGLLWILNDLDSAGLSPGSDKVGERASGARRHELSFVGTDWCKKKKKKKREKKEEKKRKTSEKR